MPGLGTTVADLLARSRMALQGGAGGDLSAVAAFGPNPGGLQMWLHAPAGRPARAPLVVVLHGCGQTANGYAAGAGWCELADRFGFVLLCPEQARSNNANLCFNWFEPGDTVRDGGEAASIAQMVRWAIAEHDVDPDRVFITGLSAGGAMTAVMLAAYPELFAAGAVVAGLPYGAASGVNQALGAMRHAPTLSAKAWGDKVRAAAPGATRWPKVSVWHGDADTTVAPDCGEALASQWCDVHDARSRSQDPTASDRHLHQLWRGADGEVAVELHRIAGLGHGTPIAAAGVDGCGAPAPWIVETGVSSSLEIATRWGIAQARRTGAASPAEPAPGDVDAPRRGPSLPLDVETTITRALKKAGLMP